MSPEDFLKAVESHIEGPASHRKRALADLRDLFATGVMPDELGDPIEYAAEVSEPVAHKADDDRSRYSRVWDPENPSILVPRVVGLGWDLNLAAIAVKLGWLRPDDTDEDVIAAIPDRVLRLATSAPTVGVALAVTASAVAAARSTGSLPSGWGARFQPNRYSSTAGALAPAIVLSTGAALWARGADGRGDELSRTIYATSLSLIGAGTAILAARSTFVGDRAQPLLGFTSLIAAPVGVSLAAGLVPIRAGLKNIWKGAGLNV